ncbi:Hypothetical Protein PANA_0351 [Pantoea ananatis LMG 20103]|uniref:Uncharacterized protein n=1 Tax=Pantoea ananatis (strain LMG 20103) TaxID=706191 RepID=D4GHY8_PANAM|nr:Hypothetical Protein PANA_0351 [Pantoea ananatis LMG 20103]
MRANSSQAHLAEETGALGHHQARALVRKVELFHGGIARGFKVTKQALIIRPWFQHQALSLRIIQQQIVADAAQPALHKVRPAPLRLPHQQMQTAIVRLPAVVPSDTIFRRPVNFKVAEGLVIKTANQRKGIAAAELAFKIGGLSGQRSALLPEVIHARIVHPAGKRFGIPGRIGHAEAQRSPYARIVTAIHFAIRSRWALGKIDLTFGIKYHLAGGLLTRRRQPQRQLPERLAVDDIAFQCRKQRQRLRLFTPLCEGQHHGRKLRGSDKHLIQRITQPAFGQWTGKMQHRTVVLSPTQIQGFS